MAHFDFPLHIQQRLDALSPRQFGSVAIYVGAYVQAADVIDHRYKKFKDAWVLAGHPTSLPEAQPYFDWLDATIIAIVRHEEPPASPRELERQRFLEGVQEALQLSAASKKTPAVSTSEGAPPPDAVAHAISRSGSHEGQNIARQLEQPSARAQDKNEAARFDAVLDQIKSEPSTPPAGIQAPDWNLANVHIEQEAFTMEQDSTLSVEFLTRAVACTTSVCKVVVQRYFDGEAYHDTRGKPDTVEGTGWIIGPRLLITNHHVINARKKSSSSNEADAAPEDFALQAQHCQILFDHFGKDESAPLSAKLLASDKSLDFAILRLDESTAQRRPLRLAEYFMLKNKQQALGFGVNILQHPNGKAMRIGFRNNYVLLGKRELLVYLTDTDTGSSGSPVCDDTWQVVALHAGSRGVSERGLIINGVLIKRENYGIPIKSILAKLETDHADIHQEILDAQLSIQPS